MKRRKKRGIAFSRLLPLAAMALLLPVAVELLSTGLPRLGKIGEAAAILAAAINMPDSSVELFRERFRAEIYNPEGESSAEEPPPSKPPSTPQKPSTTPDAPAEPAPVPELPAPSDPGPRIPSQYAAPIVSEDYSGRGGNSVLEYGAGVIKNDTEYTTEEIEEILTSPYPLRFTESSEPQVLIVHTHATESFETYDSPSYDTRNTWRSTDNRNNMVAVGDAFAQVLEERGIGVLHDTTQHDYPSYNGSYERSAKTISSYLEDYPSIRVVLDVHRDAMQREDAIIKPVAMIDGKKAAQIMIISACDDGTMNIPDWRENLRFAAAYQDVMELLYPGLTRPVFFCYRKYNMDLTPGSLLLEFGSNANTLEEAMYSATLAADALARLMQGSPASSDADSTTPDAQVERPPTDSPLGESAFPNEDVKKES